jgi:hypothetical protein
MTSTVPIGFFNEVLVWICRPSPSPHEKCIGDTYIDKG